MKKLFVFVVMIFLFSACMTVSPYAKQGELYLMNGKFDEAVQAYKRALQSDPTNPQYKTGLYRAKLAASIHYWMKGEEALAKGDKNTALKYYRRALVYQPSNEAVIRRIEQISGRKVKERRIATYRGPRAKVSLNFTRTKLKTIFKALGKYAGVNFIFDESFRNISYSISMENVDFEDALRLLCASTQNFYYKIDDKNYLIIPDTPKKREQYIAKKVKIFYLRYTNVKSLRLALGMILVGRTRTMQISYDEFLNAVLVKGTDEQIEYVEKLIDRLDRPKGEVIIQAEILEVNRSRLAQMGLDFSDYSVGAAVSIPSTSSEEGSSSAANVTLNTLRNLTADDIALVLPSAYLKFLETSTESRIMAKPLLRGLEGEKVSLKIGNRVPIPQTVFSPIAAGGVNVQPITSFQYQDVGIIMQMEPRINSKDEVTLNIKIEVSSIAGEGYNHLPILGNREVEMSVRVRGGETVIIAGLLRNEESQTVKSPPFFSRIPGIGWLFSNLYKRKEQTDVVIALTPYIVNYTEPTVEEQRPIVSAEGRGLKLKGGATEEAPPAEQMRPPARRLQPSEGSTLNIFPRRIFARKGSTFTVALSYRGEEVVSGEIVLEFSQGFEAIDVIPGGFLSSASFMKSIQGNRVLVAFTLKGGQSLRAGQIASFKFRVKGEQSGNVSVVSAVLRNASQQEIVVNLPGPVTVNVTK